MAMESIILLASAVSAVSAIFSATRKVVTTEDIKELVSKVNDLSDRVVEIEKKIAVLEYKLNTEK